MKDRGSATIGLGADRWRFAFFVLAGCAFVILFWLGRGLTFFSDEWAFIEHRSLSDPIDLFRPHNEHWSTLAIVVYRTVVELVGLRSYVPYLAVLHLLHLVAAAGVFRVLERANGSAFALGGAVLVLFFGAGFENLYWGFQIGFVAATAAGVWALALLDGPLSAGRMSGVTGLLIASLMSAGGIGLVFWAAVAIELMADLQKRRCGVWIVIPPLLYGAWYAAFGRFGVAFQRDPFTLAALQDVPGSVLRGMASVAGALTGVGPDLGLIVVAAISVVAVRRVVGGHPLPPRLIAAGCAIALEYGLVGLTRATTAEGFDQYTRYTYVGAMLGIVGLSAWVGPVTAERLGARLRPISLGLAAVLTVALVWNAELLVGGRDLFMNRAALTRALVTVAIRPQQPPGVDPSRSLVLVPSPAVLQALVARYGSPLQDALAQDAVQPIPAQVMGDAERRLSGTR